MTSLLGVPVDAAYHLIVAFGGVLTPVGAIIMFTVAVRLLVLPLSLRAMRAQAIQARLAPQVSKLRTTYGKQPERFQHELSALYKREGTSLFAGFSPLLLQWPFLSVVYLLFRSPVIGGRTNTLLTHDLLGVPLGRYWLGGAGPVSTQGLVFLGVFALLAAACWLAARLARTASPAPAGPGTGGLVRLLSYVTVVVAAFAPLAGTIYLVTSTAWTAAERRLFGPDRPQRRTTQPRSTERVARRSLPDGPANRVSPGH